MGHSANTYGKPVYTDAADFVADFQAVADFADTFANVRVGTEAERNDLMPGQLRNGLLFVETDTGKLWTYLGGWVEAVHDTDWQVLSLSPGFSAEGDPPAVKVRGGVLYARGRVKRDAGFAASATYMIGTLPAGFRPTVWTNRQLAGQSALATVRAHIDNAGVFTLVTGTNAPTYVDVSGMSGIPTS